MIYYSLGLAIDLKPVVRTGSTGSSISFMIYLFIYLFIFVTAPIPHIHDNQFYEFKFDSINRSLNYKVCIFSTVVL